MLPLAVCTVGRTCCLAGAVNVLSRANTRRRTLRRVRRVDTSIAVEAVKFAPVLVFVVVCALLML